MNLLHDLKVYSPSLKRQLSFEEVQSLQKNIGKRPTPEPLFCPPEGLGDNLLLSAVALNAFSKWKKPIAIASDYPELFYGNPHVSFVLGNVGAIRNSLAYVDVFLQCGVLPVPLRYWVRKEVNGRATLCAPGYHMIAELCRQAGLSGNILLQPFLPRYTSKNGALSFITRKNYVVVQSKGKSKWKDWGHGNFQAVVNALRFSAVFIQVGHRHDPLLEHVIDLRGRLSLNDLGEILRKATLFVGNVGGLMHFARAVETRAVIAYTGAEELSLASYSCNMNIQSSYACDLCITGRVMLYLGDSCPNNFACMQHISVDEVIEGVKEGLLNPATSPETYMLNNEQGSCDIQTLYRFEAWLAGYGA